MGDWQGALENLYGLCNNTRVQEMYTEVRQPNVLFPFRKNYLGKTLLALKVLLQVMGINWSLASLYPGGHNFYMDFDKGDICGCRLVVKKVKSGPSAMFPRLFQLQSVGV